MAILDRLRRVGVLAVGTPANDPSQGQITITGASWEPMGPYDTTAGLVLQGEVSLGMGVGTQNGPIYSEASDGTYNLSEGYSAQTQGSRAGYPVLSLTPGGSPVPFESHPFSFGQQAKFNDHAWDVWVVWYNGSQSGDPYVANLVSQHLKVVPLYRDPGTGQVSGGQITLPNGQAVGSVPAPGGSTSTPPLPPAFPPTSPPSQGQPAPSGQHYAWPILTALVNAFNRATGRQ